jgi:peptide/nickel transport system substrate-binding protein
MIARRTALSRRSFLLSGSAALASCTVVGAGGANGRVNRTTIPGTLRYTDGEGVSGLNAHLVPELSVGFLSNLHQGFLMRYDARGRPYGDLAVDVPSLANGGIAKDGKTITFRLRRGAKWSDGAPFGPDDVVFTTHVSLSSANNDLYRNTLLSIADVARRGVDEVVFRLKTPYAPFTDGFFSSDAACIYPKHLLEHVSAIDRGSYADLPIGLGPFTVARWRRDESVELVANPNFHLGRPKLDKIVYKILTDWNTILNDIRTGDLDLAMLVPSAQFVQGSRIEGYHGVTVAGGTFSQLSFNLKHPPLDDLRVRQALRYATNRRLLAQKVMHGLVDMQESPVGGQSAHTDTHIPFHEYDPKRAAALLDSAGWRAGADGIRVKNGAPLTLTLVTSTGNQERDAIAAIVQDDWRQLGVDLTIKHYPPTMLYNTYAAGGILEHGRFDVEQSHQGYGLFGDETQIWACDSQPPVAVNTSRYCNPAFDRALDAFKREYDPVRSQRLADTFQEQIAEDIPTVVLFIARDLYIASDDFKGLHPGATFDGSENWTI